MVRFAIRHFHYFSYPRANAAILFLLLGKKPIFSFSDNFTHLTPCREDIFLSIAIDVPTICSLVVETKGLLFLWLAHQCLSTDIFLYIDELLIHISSELPSIY